MAHWLPVISCLALLSVGCGDPEEQTGATSGSHECSGVTAGSKGPGAFDPSYKTSSAFFTQMSGLNQNGTSIHGATQIWYSCNLFGTFDQSPIVVPEGSVAIKVQDRNKDGVIESMRVLVKHEKGFDPKGGDFSFEARDPDGKNPKPQGASFCFGCHQGYPNTGYLAGTAITN